MSAGAPGPDEAPGTIAASGRLRRLSAGAWWELRALLGNPEQLLLNVAIPLGLLVAVTRTGLPDLSPAPQDAGALAVASAVAVVSAAFTGQAIGLAFDRRAGLVRLLVTTPLGRSGVVASRLVAVAAVLVGEIALLGVAAVLLGGQGIGPALVAMVPALAAGTACFAAFGLLLGGTVRAEAVLAVANLLWLLMLVAGGLVLPAQRLPGGPVVSGMVTWSPPGLLGESLRAAAATATVEAAPLVALLAWAALAGTLAARLLRWR